MAIKKLQNMAKITTIKRSTNEQNIMHIIKNISLATLGGFLSQHQSYLSETQTDSNSSVWHQTTSTNPLLGTHRH